MRTWCISDGNLWLVDGDRPPRQVESPFAAELVARAERDRQRDGWKHAPRDDYQGVIPASMLWGGRGKNATVTRPRFVHAVRGASDDVLYYMIDLQGASGLFRYDVAQGRETRIFHHANFNVLGMALDARRERLVIACGNKDGTANLAMYDTNGNFKGAITGGDAVDAAPSLSARDPDHVWFQSAGLARHPQRGYVMAFAPAVVNRLDYARGELATVLQDPAYDFLAPREDAAGNLYYIRRPYERSVGEHATSLAKDVFMLPWRLLKAVFGWLNFFSLIYGREPLRSAGGPQDARLERDVAALWLHGRMIALSEVKRESSGGVVPASWELRRRAPDGTDVQIARHVVSYDLGEAGSVFYSNGFEVCRLFKGEPARRSHAELIESVIAA